MSENENNSAVGGENNQVAIRDGLPPKTGAITMSNRGAKLATLDDVYRVSKYICASQFAPKGATPESVTVAILAGQEIGLPPMASLQNIAVINGRPKIFGDVMLGLVRASGLLESFSEEETGDDDEYGYRCTAVRKGGGKVVETFTIGDARQAELWGKQGPWMQYPKRMLKFRARSFALRDLFGDVLNGMGCVEEDYVVDIPSGSLAASSKAAPTAPSIRDIEDSDDLDYGDAKKPEEKPKNEPTKVEVKPPVDDAKAKRDAIFANLKNLMSISHVSEIDAIAYAQSIGAAPAMAIRIEEMDAEVAASWAASWTTSMKNIRDYAKAKAK